jgi:5-methylcytosine-specific restriction endonuclease McrA
MIQHFTHNEVFSQRLAETEDRPAIRTQLIAIIERAYEAGIDWYFTDIPDLRCGRKELSRGRATAVCFRIGLRNPGQFPFLSAIRVGLDDNQIPLSDQNLRILYSHMAVFSEANPNIVTRQGFLPNQYSISDAQFEFDLSDAQFEFDDEVANSLFGSREARLNRLQNAQPRPTPRQVQVNVFNRNPDVVAETLYFAEGKCQRCGNEAPFIRLSNAQPYLEVHHRIPLAEGGDDTVANAIALCPNCHREMHHGSPGRNDPAGPRSPPRSS